MQLEAGGGYEMEYRILLPDETQRWIGARARWVAGEIAKALASLVFPLI